MSAAEAIAEKVVGTPDKLPETEAEGLFQANERLRRIGQWLLVVFAAVGGALIAGTQLSEWGQLEGSRLTYANWGVALGFAGVLLAVWGAALLLPLRLYSLLQINREKSDSPISKHLADMDLFSDINGRPDDVRELLTELSTAWSEWVEEADKLEELRLEQAGDTSVSQKEKAERSAQAERVSQAKRRLVQLQNLSNRARFHAVYARTRHIYLWRSVPMILVGTALAAAGIALFAWASNPPDPDPVVATSLSRVDLSGRDFRGANFGTADLSGANLANSDLEGATLSKAKLAGVLWTGATCPDGTEVTGDVTTCEGHLE